MSGVPHHCHNLSLVWRHTCFVQFTKTELYPWSLYICAWFGLVIALLMVFHKFSLMCIKEVKLIKHNCLPILMLLYIMLYIVLAYLMLFAALTNAVCLNNASFVVIDLCKCFLFSCSVFVYFIFLFASCTVLLICLFFLIICSHRCCCFFYIYFLWKGYELTGEIALKNNHYYYYYYVLICIMHSAFNLLVFHNSMFTPMLFFIIERATLRRNITYK